MERGYIRHELAAHLPFSIFFTAAGIVLAALLTYVSIVSEQAGAVPVAHAHGHARTHDCGSECDHDHEGPGHEHGHHDSRGHTSEHGHHDGHDSGHVHEHHETEHPESACAMCPEHGGHVHGAGTRTEYASQMMFHIFHPIHLMLSGMATTAMFFKYDRKIWKAVLVGFIGALGVCVLSDIFLPYLGALFLRPGDVHLHVCLFEHPEMVVPFAAVGIVTGLLAAGAIHGSTVLAHSSHVFVSSAGSLFYLVSFGISDWFSPHLMAPVFILVIVSVTTPCCISDIVFPLLLARKNGGPVCSLHHHGHGPKDEEQPSP